jgi:hypothetical protein
MLPNTTLLYYGRVLQLGVSAVEAGYIDFAENKVFAGFGTSSDVEQYVRIARDHEMNVFNVYHDSISGSDKKIPAYFVMLAGPAFGPTALVNIIKHYDWRKVVVYYQNAPEDINSANTFVNLALENKVELGLQKQESSGAGAVEADFNDLNNVKSNVFVFFGGLQLSSAMCCLSSCHLTPTKRLARHRTPWKRRRHDECVLCRSRVLQRSVFEVGRSA